MALPGPLFPLQAWRITEPVFDPSRVRRNETIFSLGNGTIGLRGSFEEGFPGGVPGAYRNGFYEETPIAYGEIAYGYARNRQVMLNVADGIPVRLVVNGDPFALSTGTLLAYERYLDLQRGFLARGLTWRSPGGVEIRLSTRRIVSLARRFTAAVEWSLAIVKGEADVQVTSLVDGSVTNRAASGDPRVGAHFREKPLVTTLRAARDTGAVVVQSTRNTRQVIACAAEHDITPGGRVRGLVTSAGTEGDQAFLQVGARLGAGGTLRLAKYLGYVSSLDHPADAVSTAAMDEAAAAKRAGFAALLAEQEQALAAFWKVADVEVDGDVTLQQGLRFNLWSLLQSAGHDGRTSIAAKGLSGEGYEGHYFWDAEIYVFPFFLYTQPETARELVRYRLGTLDKARARAREMSQRGALFPWRTIGGEETSPYYPAGTAQYHINADIAHAFRSYIAATGDRSLLAERGAEMLFETARLWADLGAYIPRRGGAFCINEVTGPDEYSALVNNNLYTNLMARENLAYAAEVAGELRAREPREFRRIADAIGLADAEIEAWRQAAAKMLVSRDRERGIHVQDDGFLDRAPWDFAGTPTESYPLLLHYHPLVIYRHQVLKQPDVVLAQVLLGHLFSRAEKKRNFDFYNPLTTGDSSLSPCIQSVAAAELGYSDMAAAYFSRTARMDLDDVNGNVEDGVHTAAMAGTWISVVNGFAGMRDHDGRLSFAPRLPAAWHRLHFRLRYRGRLLDVSVTAASATYLLVEGEPLSIVHRGKEVPLETGTPREASLRPTLRCVIFDLDGVLTDTAELHYQAWQRMASELQLPFDRAVNEQLRGVSRGESLQIILRHAGVSMPEAERAVLAGRKNDYYRELIRTVTTADLLPGMPALLAALRDRGIRTGLASVSHNAAEIIRRLGIEDAIDCVVSPADVVKGKPDPEVFLRAAESLGIPCEDCAGVEDAQVGITAIKAAGMFAVGIGSSLIGADWLLPDTSGLTVDTLLEQFSAAW